jgi:mannose-6-phosphate isomerase
VLTYQPPVDDVALDVVDLAAGAVLPPEAGPRILLALEGEAVLEVAGGARRAGGARAGVPLRRGESVFVPAGEVVGARGAARLAVGRVGRR